MATITEIVDASFRTGMAKTGKPYTLIKVKLDTGATATGFAPAEVGDEVTVETTEYGLQFKTAKKAPQTDDDLSKVVNLIYKDVQDIKTYLQMDTEKAKDMVESFDD